MLLLIDFSRRIVLYLKLTWNKLVYHFLPVSDNSYYYTIIGDLYFGLSKFRKAIDAFEKSENHRKDTDWRFFRYNCYFLGFCYLNLGNYYKAVDYFEKYLTSDPEQLEVLMNTGWCYQMMRDYGRSLEKYSLLAELEPELAHVNIECAGLALKLHRNEEALKWLKIAETKTKDANLIAIIRSFKYKINGNTREAIKTLEAVINEPHPPAEEDVEALIIDFHYILFRFQEEEGLHDDALATLEKVVQLAPDDIWNINSLAMSYADRNTHLDKALKLVNVILKEQADNFLFLDTKGWILFKSGHIEESRQVFKKCLALYPDYNEARKHYGEVLKACGEQHDKIELQVS